jgi:hypothetical protein
MGVSISSGLGEIFSFGGKLIDRLIPDPAQKLAAQTELAKMAMDNSLAVMANETALIRTQTDTNLEQAKSSSLFIAGPRPALMWVGVLGVFYQWVLLPAGVFAYTLHFGKPLPVPPPAVDPNLFLTLGGLMGLQIGARSWEKAKGVAS